MSAPETDIDREQKAIAESLRLRGATPPVARVSRKALIVSAAVVSLALAGAIGWSLTTRQAKPPPEPTYQPPRPPERIAALPKDYLKRGDVPVLGPPLPGDLGRPILSAQSQAALEALPQPASPAVPPAPNPVVTARREALASGLFLRVEGTARSASAPTAPIVQYAVVDDRLTSLERLQDPASPYVLQAGAMIPATLITGLRSDAAGLAIAQVTQDVRDSLTGAYLLIPAGARLIGEYGAQTRDGQERLTVVWTRLTLPNGRALVLDKLPGADGQGMAGLQDQVDRKWGRVWSAAALSTLLAVGAESGASGEDDLARAVRRGVGGTVSDVGQQAVGRSLALTPTLSIRPGSPLRVLLTRDLVLEPYVEGARR